MEKQHYDLIELARDLGTTVEDLIRYGADDELTVYVIADEWPGKKAGNSGAKSAVIADGLVELLPTDLLKALNSEYTEVRQVKTADGAPHAYRGVRWLSATLHRKKLARLVRPRPADRVGFAARVCELAR